ncbi:MAG TPA: carboxypeptidase-like regulatory domain-containing protein [Ohtaekwangia sp.]
MLQLMLLSTGRRLLLSVVIGFVSSVCFSQTITIKKTIVSANDHQPIKLASIAIRNTSNGTYTDLSGSFTINCLQSDSLAISAIGYKKAIYSCLYMTDSIFLEEDAIQLPEVMVSSKEQKTHAINLGLYREKRSGAYAGVNAAALYIANSEQRHGNISKVYFMLSKVKWIYDQKPQFHKLLVRLKLYEHTNHNGPGKEILAHNVVQEVPEKRAEITFDIDSLNIPLPPDGIFIALEFLGYYSDDHFNPFSSNDQNKYIQYKASFTNRSLTSASWIRQDYENDWQPFLTGSMVYNFNFGLEIK